MMAFSSQTIELIESEFEKIPLDRLINEMSSRQKLIKKDKGMWSITDLGRTLINHSEHSERFSDLIFSERSE